MFSRRRLWMVIAAAALVGAACGGSTAPTAPAQLGPSPTPAPATAIPGAGVTTPVSGLTPAALATATPTTAAASGGAAGAGNPARGQAAFQAGGCVACHGDRAQAGVFPGAPKLASTALSCADLLKQVRTPKDPAKGMPPFSPAQVSDQAVNDICAWVKSLQ